MTITLPGFILFRMIKVIDYLIAFLQKLKTMDKATFRKEMKNLVSYINRQVFSQIPSVSAISGILVGSWVVSTFTTSPLRGVLASLGLMKGGTHVVSSATYKVLSVFLPILAAAVTAYLVQKVLKNYREGRLQRDMAEVARLTKEVQAEVRDKMNILERAREAGLISESEFHTKTASLYQSYTRTPSSKIEEFLINKMSG